MTARSVIWVAEPIHPEACQRLAREAEVLGPGPLPPERRNDVRAVIVRAHVVDRALIDGLPGLRVVGKHGAGLDNVDLPLMEDRGIQVFRTEGANAESVADLAVMHALTLLRSPFHHDRALRQGRNGDDAWRVGFELAERRIGILGMGAIGRAVAARLTGGFQARVLGHDPGLPEALWPGAMKRAADLDGFLSGTDLLFLHLPLLPETRHLIDARALARLRPGAFVVNCARGGIVEEPALAAALRSGHVAGAASDVFEQEPPAPDNPLFAEGLNFIGTPHLGGSTQAGLRRTGMIIAERVLQALAASEESRR